MNALLNNKDNRLDLGLMLVLGGTGKTGRRIAAALREKGVSFRIGSRTAVPAFDWNKESSWDACLDSVSTVYLNYAPDLAIPGATDSIQAFVDHAKNRGVQRIVMLSGRGETEAQACEKIVQESGLKWTVVRASWFNQNFSEGAFVEMVQSGQITLPGGDIREPWVDVDDIADVIVTALTESGHEGEVYEVTGPRLMSFEDIASDLSQATGREIKYIDIPHSDFLESMSKMGAPKDVIWLLDYLFATVLDGRNAHLTDGIQRALGRPPKDFADYASVTANTAIWKGVSQ